jgi:hypothetical protein
VYLVVCIILVFLISVQEGGKWPGSLSGSFTVGKRHNKGKWRENVKRMEVDRYRNVAFLPDEGA